MSESNRVRLSGVKEVTIGTTPNTPRMRNMRMTGESLAFAPTLVSSEEIRSDRMNAASILVGITNGGAVNFEFHYPTDNSVLSACIESAMLNTWTNTPSRDNDGTGASVITGITGSTGTVAFLTGATFLANHLVNLSGFTAAGNNGIQVVTTGGTTSLVVGAGHLTDDASPAAAARVKVVGIQGATSDLTATASGLASTALDFTTLGLSIGQWLLIGGNGAVTQFATAANNDWVRISGTISAHAIPLDNLPSGWGADNGSAKTIRIFFGDYIANGVTKNSLTLERGFLDQTVPTYIAQKGMAVNKWTVTIPSKERITGSFEFQGMNGSQSTTSLDAVTDAAPDPNTYPIMAGSANVGRMSEFGAALQSPNWAKQLAFTITNNYVGIDAVDSIAPVDLSAGSCDVQVTLDTYFGNNSLLTRMFNNTITTAAARVLKNKQAVVFGFPALVMSKGNPNATKKNERVMLGLTMDASIDTITNSQITVQRFERYLDI